MMIYRETSQERLCLHSYGLHECGLVRGIGDEHDGAKAGRDELASVRWFSRRAGWGFWSGAGGTGADWGGGVGDDAERSGRGVSDVVESAVCDEMPRIRISPPGLLRRLRS